MFNSFLSTDSMNQPSLHLGYWEQFCSSFFTFIGVLESARSRTSDVSLHSCPGTFLSGLHHWIVNVINPLAYLDEYGRPMLQMPLLI
jgi:hypothetical protein